MNVVLDPQDAITQWVFQETGGRWVPGMAAGIGVVDGEGRPVAAAAFTDFNGSTVSVHLVVKDPRASVRLFEAIGVYAFEQLGCRRLTLIAESSNLQAVKLHEKLGAVHEGRLVGAGRKGDDILISRLQADSPIWRKLNGRRLRKLGQGRRTAAGAASPAAATV